MLVVSSFTRSVNVFYLHVRSSCSFSVFFLYACLTFSIHFFGHHYRSLYTIQNYVGIRNISRNVEDIGALSEVKSLIQSSCWQFILQIWSCWSALYSKNVYHISSDMITLKLITNSKFVLWYNLLVMSVKFFFSGINKNVNIMKLCFIWTTI